MRSKDKKSSTSQTEPITAISKLSMSSGENMPLVGHSSKTSF